jgi:hypothetical protein
MALAVEVTVLVAVAEEDVLAGALKRDIGDIKAFCVRPDERFKNPFPEFWNPLRPLTKNQQNALVW